MILFFSKHHLAIGLIFVTCISLSSAHLRAEEPSSFSSNIAEGTKDYLSDPARAGSLVGTIIAGAAIANPLAPILGSIAGFFIGKDTDYTNTRKAAKNAFARRSLIPGNNTQIASLSGLTDTQTQVNNQPTLGLVEELSVGGLSQTEGPIVLGLVEELSVVGQPPTVVQSLNLGLPKEVKGRGTLQQQLASACSNVSVTQQLPVYCYYYSQ